MSIKGAIHCRSGAGGGHYLFRTRSSGNISSTLDSFEKLKVKEMPTFKEVVRRGYLMLGEGICNNDSS